MDKKTKEFKANYRFNEGFIPPRCRKMLCRPTNGTCVVTIPVATEEEAPVVLSYPSHLKTKGDNEVYANYYNVAKDIRRYDGNLYCRVTAGDKYCGGIGWWKVSELKHELETKYSTELMRAHDTREGLHTAEDCERNLSSIYAEYLLVQVGKTTQVWRKCGEPMYAVFTFGLGHNHGGTSLSIQEFYNPNINKERYFTALQYEEAQAKAIEIAKARGDTKYVRLIKKAQRIKVYDPTAVKRNPAVEAGEGDAFVNGIENLIQSSGSATEAGLLAVASTMAQISGRR